MIEVAFDDPDNTSLFLSSSDIQLLSVKFDQQALLSFRPVFSFSFFYFFFIYIYIYILFFYSLPMIMVAHIIVLISLHTMQ